MAKPSIHTLISRTLLGAERREAMKAVGEQTLNIAIPVIIGAGLTLLATQSSKFARADGTFGFELLVPYVLIVMCAVFLLILFAGIAYMRSVTERLRIGASYRVQTWRDETLRLGEGASGAYDYCKAVAKGAKKNILALGPHFTDMLPREDKPTTVTHNDYLKDGMEKAIARHMNVDDEDKQIFEYIRILQVDPDHFDRVEDGVVDALMVGDDGLASHIATVLELNLDSEDINVEIYARAFVPSFPSILIVDDTYVFFSLPTCLSSTRTNNGAPEFRYDFVLGIEDKSHRIPLQFRKAIRQFTIDAKRIRRVEGIDTPVRPGTPSPVPNGDALRNGNAINPPPNL